MACYSPLQAWKTAGGDVVFVERGDLVGSLTLACGRCIGCRLERSRQWAVRVMHEAQCWPASSFVTLTYDDPHMPRGGSLVYSDFQRFMKYLRRDVAPKPVRFFMCGEYGDDLGRPHFHVALFNEDFARPGWQDDRYFWRKADDGSRVHRSPWLERLWDKGLSEVGELSFKSAAYIARYVMKKVTGDLADEHYKTVDAGTGEIVWREPEFVRMSLRPGVGFPWFERFNSDVYPHDRVISNGVPAKPPRYYDKLLKRRDPALLEDLQAVRVARARERYFDNTPERLAVRERVTQARVSFLKRELK